eukprot:gene9820-13213_t
MSCGECHCGQDAENDQVKIPEGWTDDFTKNTNRKCTDILFTIILILAWIAMTLVGFVACGVIPDNRLPAGNPARLTNAIDYRGRVCGNTAGVIERKYGYYMLDTTVVCVKECPTENNYFQFICKDDYQSAADNSTIKAFTYVAEKQCMYEIKTQRYLNRCFPQTDTVTAALDAINAASSVGGDLNTTSAYEVSNYKNNGWFSKFVADVINLRGYVFGFGFGVSLGFALLYLYLLQIPHLLMLIVWTIAFSIFALLIIGSFLLWALSNKWNKDDFHTNSEIVTMRVFAYTGMAFSGLYFCLMVVMRKRIVLAVHVVEVAADAVSSMLSLILLPVIQTFGLACFFTVWFVYVIYLASSGDILTKTGTYTSQGQVITYNYRTFEYTVNTKYAFLYMLFIWYWTSEFVVALGQLTISLAISCWYFTRDKSLVGSSTVFWAIGQVGYFHTGTAAFGALVIAIIKTIRTVIAYIQKKAKQSKNIVVEYIMCLLGCFMWCLEKCMKFLNKHAYIITSIYSYSFCFAARKAFFLLLRNILRVAAVNTVAAFIIVLCRFFVPIMTTFLCYLTIAYTVKPTEINGLIAVLVFTFLISYWISSLFSEIFGMAIETILFCFIADEEMFPVEQRYAEGALAATLQKTAQAAAQMKEERKKKRENADGNCCSSSQKESNVAETNNANDDSHAKHDVAVTNSNNPPVYI